MPQKINSTLSTPPRELAKQLVHALKSGRVASAFLESYAKQFDRPEATAHPERRRELETMLEREMLLAMTSHIARATEIIARTRRTSRAPQSKVDPAKFLRDLLAGIASESNWTAGDAIPFWARFRPTGNYVFDLENDPTEDENLIGGALEAQLAEQLRAALVEMDAPKTQFERLGFA